MVQVGIEAMNVFGGSAYVDVMELAEYRKLDLQRFNNLMMKEKTVALPCEDPVTFAVNAAKPILDSLSEDERSKIELLITCTESGIDFGKSLSTYVHDYLKLSRNCRLFEIKQACYSGTAGLQMASGLVLSQLSPGAKALVISTDISRFLLIGDSDAMSMDWSFAEPSGGAGAVAMLISDNPRIFQIDRGASGYYTYEVMDTCRPVPDSEAGDADLSLMSYLDCCQNSFNHYQKRVEGADFLKTFDFLAFHTPFGGMVKGAHRTMLRRLHRMNPAAIEEDFERRVSDSLIFCQRVGNIMGGTLFLALASLIDKASIKEPKRVGCFSYGSGCASEFFSGVITSESQKELKQLNIEGHLNQRYKLSMKEYTQLLEGSSAVKFGTRSAVIDPEMLAAARSRGLDKCLFLKEINEFHRRYEWS
ncbi:MAG: hydroxymethylglutaryl-CoA synthase family protein [Blastocatellia bacterium]|nr:hydroxymethylglutaryl-CoA synthase family protein [Blastocatellia bacterium]